uniref:Uncharacterized protein n=1 Tax=Anguilla anguilla TaxID=7936 RepID=A0A0E9V057_ANGAN
MLVPCAKQVPFRFINSNKMIYKE